MFGIPKFEHITHLKGDGWVLSREQVIADMDVGRRYYVENALLAPRAYLQIMPPISAFGGRYVRTEPDASTANNLLSLPRF